MGDGLGNFHTEFEMTGAKSEIYAIESLFLAKKVYLDRLESVDENSNTIHDYHIRLKSAPTSCVKHTCEMLELSPFDLYKYLYKPNIKVVFDLTEDGKNCGFKFEKDMTVRPYNDGEFHREIGFPADTVRVEIQ